MIEFQADGLLQGQEKELAARDMNETYVKLKNSEYSVNLSIESYLSQFEFKNTDSVKNTIENDVQKELDNRMNMEVAKQNEERRKEQEKINQEHDEHVPFEPTMSEIDDTDDLPFGDIEPEREEMTITLSLSPSEKLELTGYLQTKGFDWRVV